MTSDGLSTASWRSDATAGSNTMNVDMQINSNPTNYFAQIFSTGSGAYFKLQSYSAGTLKYSVKWSNGTDAYSTLTTALLLNTNFNVKVVASPYLLKLAVIQGSNTWSISYQLEGLNNDLYFKTGAYCQIKAADVNYGTNFCQMAISKVAISHV